MNKKIVGICALILASQGLYADTTNTATSIVNSFEKKFGVTEGKRRNHTKGFCFNATLTPNDNAILKYTNSSLFKGESRVIGRLSQKGGNNAAPDNKPAEYGMGLAISTSSGDRHLMSMNTLDFFSVATPEAFAELMRAKTQGANAVKLFKQKDVNLQRFKAHSSKKSKTLKPYEGSRFNSINSFYLVNDGGEKTAVRWSFVPAQNQEIVLEPKQDFFFENMQKNLSNNDIVWNMVVTLANKDDQINNAALPWEGEHKQIIAAKLKVSSISSEEAGKCDGINYDPLVLSSGFEPSADPLLQTRRDAYAISFGKRISEKQK